MPSRTLITRSEEETRRLGVSLAERLGPGDVVLLEGALGMGKTVFARGLASGLGAADDEVRSPTFTLVNMYRGRLPVYHVDLYRIDRPEDLDELGLEEVLGGDAVAIVEWAERLGPYHPASAYRVRIADLGGSEREVVIDEPDSESR